MTKKEIELFNDTINDQIDAVLLCNNAGFITHANHACVNVFGYEPEELVGKKIEILVPDGLTEKHKELRKKYMQNPFLRKTGQVKLLSKHKNGSTFNVDIALSPVISIEGVPSVIAVIRPLTDIALEMEQIKQKLEKLKVITR